MESFACAGAQVSAFAPNGTGGRLLASALDMLEALEGVCVDSSLGRLGASVWASAVRWRVTCKIYLHFCCAIVTIEEYAAKAA